MRIIPTELPGVLIVEPQVFPDPRGFFLETYNRQRYAEHGIRTEFVQDNHSRSVRDTLRGLHYQAPPGQAKLVSVARGQVYDVAVDIRRGSPTYGRWVATVLSDENHRQLFMPAGFAHGFCVLSDVADFVYKVSTFYAPELERGIAWDDPDLAIPWPVAQPLLSERDRHHPHLRDIPAEYIISG